MNPSFLAQNDAYAMSCSASFWAEKLLPLDVRNRLQHAALSKRAKGAFSEWFSFGLNKPQRSDFIELVVWTDGLGW